MELCSLFYRLGWASGTGGSISIRQGDNIFMAPSGVQKERMLPRDIFVIDMQGRVKEAPQRPESAIWRTARRPPHANAAFPTPCTGAR